jgi:ABC-type glutathione transport system ATPase component
MTDPDLPVVETQGLTKTFRGRRGSAPVAAVAGVDLVVTRGACVAIVGESGSGKTTLARIIVGLESATTGTVKVMGQQVSPKPGRAERRRRAREVQMVFQDPNGSLNRRRTVGATIGEVLRFHHRLGRTETQAEVSRLLDSVGMDGRHADALPDALSGGQRQRVAIARALAARPSILVLDEAVAALDVSVQAQVLNLLAELRRETDLTYLFITHDLSVVRQVADEIVVMRRGVVVEQGTTSAILDRPQHPYTQLLRACAPRAGWRPTRRRSLEGSM